jgi:hypothetical protein
LGNSANNSVSGSNSSINNNKANNISNKDSKNATFSKKVSIITSSPPGNINFIILKENTQQAAVKSPKFCSKFEGDSSKLNISNNNLSLDLTGINDIMTSTYNKFEDELNELNELENFLRSVKQDLVNINMNDFAIEENSLSRVNSNSKNYPFSDGEDNYNNKAITSILNDSNKQNNSIASKNISIISTPTNNLSNTAHNPFGKKNGPLLTQVTIDLIGNKSSNNSTINNTATTVTTVTGNKKRSESNKSDNVTINKPRKGIK